jgi:hypothetical protein
VYLANSGLTVKQQEQGHLAAIPNDEVSLFHETFWIEREGCNPICSKN